MTRSCPGPIPPGTPKLKAPPGSCDSHIHVLGPYDRYPLGENRSYTAPEATAADCRALLDALGVDRSVVVHASPHGADMRVTLDAIEAMGIDRTRGVAVVAPDISDAKLDRLHDGGIRGVRVQTMVKGGMDFGEARRIADRIARLGWHVEVMMNGAAQVPDALPLLADLPVDLVIDHMGCFNAEDGAGHPAFLSLLDFVRGGRVWVKLSAPSRRSSAGPPYRDMAPFARALIEIAPDRMVWGTDWPHVAAFDHPIPDDADLLDWVLEWDVDEPTRRAILVDNPARLYGFG
jgi:predicted TIM-barrel fold metal-dependent hydrolase